VLGGSDDKEGGFPFHWQDNIEFQFAVPHLRRTHSFLKESRFPQGSWVTISRLIINAISRGFLDIFTSPVSI
jgi:hypothetical protein